MASRHQVVDGFSHLFNSFKDSVLNTDPVYFVENNLNVDGNPLKLRGNGYKPFVDIYRYIALTALEPTSKPIVLVKGRQVGATTMAAALESYFVACGLFGTNGRPPMRIMHLFPTLSLAAAYTKDKLDPIITASRPMPGEMKSNGLLKSFLETKLDSSNSSYNNTHFKKFVNNNQVWIESTGLDGDRVRGRTCDLAMFDEVQDISDLAMGAVSKILTQAKYGPPEGVQVYFGTPKQKGGSYWKMWQHSTQNYYHLRCEKCGEYFPLYRPDVNWEDVWVYFKTVKCPTCGCEQDKIEAAERGKWIPMNDENDPDITFVGFHINQLYIPKFSREDIEKTKPEKSPVNTERIYMNEVIGEFYDGEGGTLSIEQIHEKCADKDRAFATQISPAEGKRVYVGFDWGQRGELDARAGRRVGRSYSCAVVLTADGPNLFNIEFATRLMRNDDETKIEIVEEMFRRYSISLAVGDIGDAFGLTQKLQRMYDDKFLASRSSHKVNGHIKYSSDEFPKIIVFEKDFYIGEIIGLLKNGNVKFPYKSFNRIDWLVNHCASMDIKVTKDKSGESIKHYVKGSSPNDGLMALLNAYLAWKFDVTQGFKIHNPMHMKYDVATTGKEVQAVLGYLPRFSNKI